MTATPRILRNVHSSELPPLQAKPTSITAGQQETTDPAYTSPATQVEFGVYEVTPGRFTTVRDGVDEVILVVAGSGTLYSPNGETLDHSAGDIVLLPNGWSGEWEIHETLRKVYLTATL